MRIAPSPPNTIETVVCEQPASRATSVIVTRRLAETPYLAGDAFTAADISVTYALQLAQRTVQYPLGEVEQAYLARTTARDGYGRAMDTRHATKAWVTRLAAQ